MLKFSLLTIALLASTGTALAQRAPVGGGELQQIPPAPIPQRAAPDIQVERREPPANPGPPGPKILVNSLHITGETLFPEAELIVATGFKPGQELSLGQLRTMASWITRYYDRRGYFLAQAYLPVQDINAGVVTIAVIEGRYGKIVLRNRTRLSDRQIWGVLRGLKSGDIVETAPLERRLLLISDIPGVRVRSTLTPGVEVGTSDLIVDVTPGPLVSGEVDADNAGNRYTGSDRLGATVYLNDPTGHGDQLSVRALTSFDGLNYIRGAYQIPIQNLTVGVAYAALDYRLGKEFKSLDARGSAQIASAFASYPLIRSYNDNLYVLVDFDFKTFQDKLGNPASVTDKRAEVGTIGFYGNHHDSFVGGGWNTYSLYGSYGDLDIQSAAARLIDAATARTSGGYGKLTFDVSRLQNLVGPLSLYGEVRGQIASKNLDISEKMELGGAYGVRAYPEGEAYGDDGYIATAELRWLLPRWSAPVPGRAQLFGFVDTGSVIVNESPWVAGHNRLTRSGAGVGALWEDPGDFLIRATYAWELGDTPATSAPNAAGRFWIQVVKYF